LFSSTCIGEHKTYLLHYPQQHPVLAILLVHDWNNPFPYTCTRAQDPVTWLPLAMDSGQTTMEKFPFPFTRPFLFYKNPSLYVVVVSSSLAGGPFWKFLLHKSVLVLSHLFVYLSVHFRLTLTRVLILLGCKLRPEEFKLCKVP
jgi:hypothetical protein